MQIKLLKIEEVADLIEHAEYSGNIVKHEQTPFEIVYHIQDGTGEHLLINTSWSSYLISHDGCSDGQHTPFLSLDHLRPIKRQQNLLHS
ncbi:hypothetical protein ACKER9_02090 [Acinetobacter baumannii]|uniref:hypothetical protein n=1 Tax=Acinetobacter TaxID=469 RepID=UPI0005537E9F|nr:hypothetical protein [Acinetobacter radioresistens]